MPFPSPTVLALCTYLLAKVPVGALPPGSGPPRPPADVVACGLTLFELYLSCGCDVVRERPRRRRITARRCEALRGQR